MFTHTTVLYMAMYESDILVMITVPWTVSVKSMINKLVSGLKKCLQVRDIRQNYIQCSA